MVFPASDFSPIGNVTCHKGNVLPSTPGRYFLSYLVQKYSLEVKVGGPVVGDGEGNRSVVYAIVTPLSLSQPALIVTGLHLTSTCSPLLYKSCPRGSEPQDLPETESVSKRV